MTHTDPKNRRDALKALGAVSFVPLATQTAEAQTPAPPPSQAPIQPAQPTTRPARVKAPPPPNVTQTPATSSTTSAPAAKPAGPPAAPNNLADFKTKSAQVADTLRARKSLLSTIPATRLETAFRLGAAGPAFPDIRCDILATEAAALLARCLITRKDWEGIYEASYAFLSDLERFDRLDAIFQLQEANGYYDLDFALSQADVVSNSVYISSLTYASDLVDTLVNRLTTTYDDQYGWIQLLGWLSHISAYGNSGSATARVSWNGVEDTVISYCYKAAVAQGDVQLSSLLNQLSADLETRRAQLAALNAKTSALQSKATWDQKNQTFRQLQTQAMRAIYGDRHNVVTQPGGAMNFTERLANLQTSFDATLSDALARFPAISTGFSTVFGISAPLPTTISNLITHGGSPAPSDNILDTAQQWLDNIGSQHSRMFETEQVYSVSIGLRALLSQTQWVQFVTQKPITFQIGDGVFPDQRYVRLRAISVAAVGVHQGTCSTVIKVPANSYYVHADGKKYACQQSFVKPLRYSRVTTIDRPGGPERFGTNAIYNCAPFGQWTLTLTEHQSAGANLDSIFDGLQDLYLEFIVAGQ